MLLKHVYLYLHLDEYPADLATPFGFRTRYVCNFLERRLRELRCHADGFNKICVQGRRRPLEACPVVSDHAALPTVAFDQAKYESLRPGEEHEFFIAMIVEGLERCARQHRIPIAELRAAVEEFRRGGCRNEWTHQKKLLRQLGVQASLLCSLDPERFRLNLKLEKKGVAAVERRILETKPDELIFAHRFKDVLVDGDSVVVKDTFGKTTFSMRVPRALREPPAPRRASGLARRGAGSRLPRGESRPTSARTRSAVPGLDPGPGPGRGRGGDGPR